MNRTMKSALIICTLLVLMHPAAGGQTRSAVPATVPVPPAETFTRELFQAAGTQALVNVLVWPDGWKDAATDNRIALAKTLSLLIERQVDGERFSDAPDALGGLLVVLGGKPCLSSYTPGWWPGWDSSRPLVAALFEAPVGYLELARAAFGLQRDSAGLMGLRHRVLVPASDAPRLAEALRQSLPAFGEWVHLTRDLHHLLQGGSIHPVGERGLLVAVIPERNWVRLELFVEDFGDPGAVARWLQPIRVPDPAEEVAATPAERFVTSARDRLGALYVRSWRFDEVLGSFHASRSVPGLRYADPAERGVLFAKGLSEVFQARALSADLGTETVDIGVTISASTPLRIKHVVSLTDLGVSAYLAGLDGADDKGCSWFDDTTRIDAASVVESSEAPPVFELLENQEDIGSWFRSCGQTCVLSIAVRQPIGSVIGMLKLKGEDPTPTIEEGFGPALFSSIVPENLSRGNKQSMCGLCGKAVVSELVLGATGNDTPVFSPVARYAEMTWEEPGTGNGDEQAALCLLRMLVEVAKGLEQVAYAGPGKNLVVLSALQEAQQDNRACAAANPALVQEADEILALLELLYEDIAKHSSMR